jgi:protein-tyrosine phosphatase
MVFILENLALGNLEDAQNPPPEITLLLNVADDASLSNAQCQCHNIPCKDGQPLPPEKIIEIICWIEKNIASDKILVFCRYGRGRSASAIISYLCRIGFSYKKAVEFVKAKKPDINPLPLLSERIQEALGNLKI